MIRNVRRTWFEVWGTEQAQNRFLKALLVFFVAQNVVLFVMLGTLALRKPPLIAVSATESRILTVVPPKKELLEGEVRRAVTGYLNSHYNWEWEKIGEAFQLASHFVSPDFSKAFLMANQEQTRIARDKKVSQRFYIVNLGLELKTKTVRITGDRIILVEGLRAASQLAVDVQFDYGARTEENPEGIYIVGEKLVSSN